MGKIGSYLNKKEVGEEVSHSYSFQGHCVFYPTMLLSVHETSYEADYWE